MADTNSTVAKGTRKAFAQVEQTLPWRLSDAGLSVAHPLKAGSAVLAVHLEKVFFCIVLAVFERGGGKVPTHNHVDGCISVSRLSRFVAQAYVPSGIGGTFHSPLVASPRSTPGAAPSLPSYLFLRSESLILSLDSMASSATMVAGGLSLSSGLIQGVFPAGGGLVMLVPTANLTSIMDLAHSHDAELAAAVRESLKSSRKRNKPEAVDGDEVVTSKKHCKGSIV